MGNIDWSKEQRQAPIGLLLFAAQTFRNILKGAWPIFLLFIIKDGDSRNELYFWAIILGTAFILINGSLSYWYFRFNIEGDEFVVRKGYLKKIKLAVAIDRIQTVNIKQSIFQRIIGVVTVEIDTAGAKEAEIKLIAIKKELASEFEKRFGRTVAASIDTNDIETSVSNDAQNVASQSNNPLIELSVEDLVKVGVSQNHLKNLLVVIAFVYSFYYQLGQTFQNQIEEYAEKGMQNIEKLEITTLVMFIIVIFAFAFIASIIKMVVKYYGLTMQYSSGNYVISYGLINTKKVNIPIHKIQLIIYEDNPIKKLLGFKNLSLNQASSNENVKKDQKIIIPACNSKQQEIIEKELFGSADQIYSPPIKSHPFYFIKSFLFFSAILAPLLGVIIYNDKLQDLRFVLPILIIEIIVGFLLFLDYKKRNFRISQCIIEINKGQIGNTYKRMYMYKVQSVSIKQSVFMKRRNLATIVLYTAAGNRITIPYIESEVAYNTANYILFKIESSIDAWM
ncbi:MAG: PH domain-containing protein [Bacteroidales bacterium]|nr:PH domain-containing protein [Bacteroidales bacterium]